MDLTPVTDLLAKIPGSAWGAIGGALLTLIPVILGNRHNRKQQVQQQEFEGRQQSQQLEFESNERQRERHASLRRDVYLPAADAFVGLVSGLGRLINLETPASDIGDSAQVFGAALTRIQMVASPATITRGAELQREVVITISKLQQFRHPMMLRQQQINVAANVLKAHDDQLEAFENAGARLTSGRQPSSDDVEHWVEARAQYRHVSERREEARIDWLRLMVAQETARAEMFREYVVRIEALVKLQMPLLAAIRGELENDEALQLIMKEAEQTNAVGVRAVTDLIPMIERNAEEMRRDLSHYEQRKLAKAAQEQAGQEGAGH